MLSKLIPFYYCDGNNTDENKRLKVTEHALNAIAEEYICPLSMELMIDPVTGELLQY